MNATSTVHNLTHIYYMYVFNVCMYVCLSELGHRATGGRLIACRLIAYTF